MSAGDWVGKQSKGWGDTFQDESLKVGLSSMARKIVLGIFLSY
jgi:hypothetical protein